MEKGEIATHTDDVPHTPLNFHTMFKKEAYTKENLKNHFKKWWWVHLFIFSCGVLLVALPLVYVGYPNIAQGVVNGADISLLQNRFYNPTPSTTGFYIWANVVVHSIFHAHLDLWNATLYLKGAESPNQSLLEFPIPAFKSVTGTKLGVNGTLPILHEDAFNAFTQAGFLNKTFQVSLKGRGGLKLGALPHIHVNYNKIITIPGLNGLKELETTNLKFITDNPPAGVNTVGNVTINNPSVLDLQLGDTAFDIYLNNGSNIVIGNATIPNLRLAPGNNTYPLNLYSQVANVFPLVQNPAYGCGVLPVLVKGRGCTVNGVDIPYFSKAFQAASITTNVDVTSVFQGLGIGSSLSGTCS